MKDRDAELIRLETENKMLREQIEYFHQLIRDRYQPVYPRYYHHPWATSVMPCITYTSGGTYTSSGAINRGSTGWRTTNGSDDD